MSAKQPQHTPGPWKVTEYATGIIDVHNDDETVCRIPQFLGESAPANALLIAAAPALLEAAERAERLGHDSYTPDDWNTAMRALRAAIAQAKGGE